MFHLPKLPFNTQAFGEWQSDESFLFHYGKHHKKYIDTLNELIEGTANQKKTLEEIVVDSDGKLFNNASQAYNHCFFWHCLSEDRTDLKSQKDLAKAIDDSFNGFENFKKSFIEAGANQFGSGWAWLAKKQNGQLAVYSSHDAESPLQKSEIPILTCDVWEHAYYIDHRNEREEFLKGFFDHVNWQFAAKNYALKSAPNMTEHMR